MVLVARCLLRILCSRPNYTLVPAAQMSVNLVYVYVRTDRVHLSKFLKI
jgi:hypothetical protein